MNNRPAALVAALCFAAAAAACGGDDDKGTAQAAGAGGGSGGAAGGGRGGASVVLAASDVAPARPGTIEAATPISGDLRPVERVIVRARLEGDLVGVYVREGDRVREGQLLARFEGSEQEGNRQSAVADRVAATAALSTARWNAEQSEELFRAGAIPERDVRAAREAVTGAQARTAAAEARVRAASLGSGDTRVLSPTSGTVELRSVEGGESVARNAELFTIVRTDVLELAAAVPARLAGDLRAGQAVRFTADGRAFEGRVARVSPTVDPSSRSVTVYVQIPNRDGDLRGNTFATGRVIGRTIAGALLVPLPAVRTGTGGDSATFAYRVAGDRLEKAPIRVGVTDDQANVAEVLEGLKPGDRVVVGNVGTLGAGMRVQVIGEPGRAPAGRAAAGGAAVAPRAAQ